MAIIVKASGNININPNVTEMNTYQKKGLRPQDRKPTDYLRMVARTFSTFRSTPAQETVVSYIHGFEVSVNSQDISIQDDWTAKVKPYNIFRIKAGACMIDNQLIDIYEDTHFIFEPTEFIPDTKYGIVIEYDYLQQHDANTARIRFINYNSLHFPRIEDKNVVSCEFSDESLDGNYSTTEFSGRPGLLIATFKTTSLAHGTHIVQSNPPVIGDIVPGIDPQYLSKLYIQNYKLLFEYFGSQSRAIYSSMGMTNANFTNVSYEMIYKSDDPDKSAEEDLRSGDMCYFDGDIGKFKRSVSSRQKFSQVIGLYLNEVNEGNHLIYTGGVISMDAVKHNLPDSHQLLNMLPGTHYYLEDADSMFDTQMNIRTIDNYVLANSSGRISNRFYPNSVRVGFSMACNQIVLNIDHSAEIGTGNLLSLFGNYDEYKKEYLANSTVEDMKEKILVTTQDISNDNVLRNKLVASLGTNDNIAVASFYDTYSSSTLSPDFTQASYTILSRHFVDGYDAESIYEKDLNILENDTPDEIHASYANIKEFFIDYRNIYNIRNSILETISDINSLIQSEKDKLTTFIASFKIIGLSTKIAQLDHKLTKARYAQSDMIGHTDDFENYYIQNETSEPYTTEKTSEQSAIDAADTLQESRRVEYFSNIFEINKLKRMRSQMAIFLNALQHLIGETSLRIATLDAKILSNSILLTEYNDSKNEAAGNVMNNDVSKIDIFQMDEHQRNVFNYTYITDRLQKRLLLVDRITTELEHATSLYTAVHNNPNSLELEILASINEVARLRQLFNQNKKAITNYTLEYNVMRVELFGLDPITEGDPDFIEGGVSDQNIGNYRYGCDDYKNTYNGIASNLITLPCGPYTTPYALITPKNSGWTVHNVMDRDGHSDGKNITLHSLNAPHIGTIKKVRGFRYTPKVATNFENYIVKNGATVIAEETTIGIGFESNSKTYTFYTSVYDGATYTLYNSTNDLIVPANGIIELFEDWVIYKPKENYAGTDICGYVITDNEQRISTGTININVAGPYALPDTYKVSKNTPNNLFKVLDNDGHTNRERIILLSATNPSHGTIVVTTGTANTVGEIKYTPTTDYIGVDDFSYVITDGDVIHTVDPDSGATIISTNGTTATGTVSINVVEVL